MSQRTGSSALFLTWLFFLFFIFCSPLTSAEGGNKRKTKSFARTSVNLAGTKFNINNISTDFYNDGESDYSIRYGSDGLIYPKGSGKGAVFASGFLWAGKINGEIRSGGAGYRSGLVPGRVLPEGVPADQSDPSARIYRVRPDYKTADLSSEVNDGEGTADQVRAQYEKDWNDWPAKYGAPYEDINKDGKYEPSVDIPGVPGAGQTIWFAANDFDPAKTTLLYGSQPMGFEVQVTVWGYKAPSPFGDVLFRKYKLINKGNNDVTDMYIGMFSDVDDGGPEDDVCGCDSALQLGYIYNFTETDWVYGQFTPAVGFTLMQDRQ